jgi:predicted amidophosphoribosyltransferase
MRVASRMLEWLLRKLFPPKGICRICNDPAPPFRTICNECYQLSQDW